MSFETGRFRQTGEKNPGAWSRYLKMIRQYGAERSLWMGNRDISCPTEFLGVFQRGLGKQPPAERTGYEQDRGKPNGALCDGINHKVYRASIIQ
jgi:hypothetical protein